MLKASRDVAVVGRSAQVPMLPSEVQYVCGDFGQHETCEQAIEMMQMQEGEP